MLKLKFIPESEDFADSAKSYSDIWENDGKRIVEAIEAATTLQFKEEFIKVTVFESVSQSHPMKLRASYDDETKKATLVHELLHRIRSTYMLPLPEKDDNLSLGLHKQINLLLFDLWSELFGTEVAVRQVKIESSRTQMYKQAWDWALKLNKEQRQEKFAKLRSH